MKTKFVTKEISVELRKIGFDEPGTDFPLWGDVIDWFMHQGLFITYRYFIPESYSYVIFPTKERFKDISGGYFDRSIYDNTEGFYKAREMAILKCIELMN